MVTLPSDQTNLSPVQKASSFLYLFGTFLLAVSLPWSKFLMSNAEIILLLSWLLDKNLSEKIKNFLKNKTAVILSSVFILHLIGLAYTTDYNLGMEDVRKKIPLLLLPLIFSTSPPFSKKILERILSIFIISVLAASFVCFYILLGYSNKIILQPRDASVFISHIRFSLLMSFSVFLLGYFLFKEKTILIRSLSVIALLWLILFMFMMESETGLVCIGIATIILMIYGIFKLHNYFAKTVLAVLLLTTGSAIAELFYYANNKLPPGPAAELPRFTKSGNVYSNDTLNYENENGNKVWTSVCEKELQKEWEKRSNIKYDGRDLKGNELKYTLIRFLASKGIPKDSASLSALTGEEIRAVEKGIPNAEYMKILNPLARIQKIEWEFENYIRGGNPSGHSVVQRFEFWKAAIGIIKENLFFGVGTGDLDIAFADQYEKMNSPLTKEWRLRSHNQFLAITAAFGITGLLWFLFSLLYPVVKEKKVFNYFYITFFIIALLSFLTEDTLETQAGVTFFAFFNSLLLFCGKKEDHTGS